MPLALAWEERDEERVRNLATAAVAKIRQQANVGVMGDAFADEMFCRAMVAAMAASKEIATAQGKLQVPTDHRIRAIGGARLWRAAGGAAARLQLEYRRDPGRAADAEGLPPLARGVNPELEMGLVPHRSRALSELRAAGRRAGVPGQ